MARALMGRAPWMVTECARTYVRRDGQKFYMQVWEEDGKWAWSLLVPGGEVEGVADSIDNAKSAATKRAKRWVAEGRQER